MKDFKIFIITTCTLLNLICNAQFNVIANVPANTNPSLPNRGCGTGVLPDQFETWVKSMMPTGKYGQAQLNSVFNIPVIVHVIHNNEAVNSVTATTGNNLNAAQIINQLNILNLDFNGTNSDTSLIPTVFKPAFGKLQFNFCLAVVNPTGGVLAEPGIDRIDRNVKGWTAPPYSMAYITSTIKPNSIWDPTKYMNMWVCGITGGILGFATFPNPGTSGLGGFSPPYGTTTTDGLVMRNTSFGSIGTAANAGPYNLGRTATHEIGHWLGLRHIWGDGTCATDYCADTPPAQNQNYGCPTHPFKSGVCTGNSTGEMFMNFMDYTDDACMYMFSKNQKTRAQIIMTYSPLRSTLLTSTVCNLPTVINEVGILYIANPSYSQTTGCNNFINPSVIVHNFGTNTISTATYSYNVDGVNTQTLVWNGTLYPNTSQTISLPQVNNIANGPHIYNVGIFAPNGNTDPYLTNNTNNQAFTISNSFTMSISGPTAVCAGNSATLAAGGTASTYSWNPGAVTGTALVVTPLSTTIYTLTGKTGTCANTRTVSITVSSPPVITAPSATICAGTSTIINASGACSYTYSPGGTSFFNPMITTTYTVAGSCGPGCISYNSGTITVVPNPTLSVVNAPVGALCSGATATLTAGGASSYTWNTGQTGNILVVNPSSTTIYTVIGKNGNCAGTKTATVLVGGTTLSVNIVSPISVICAGSSVILSGSGATSYTWSTGAITPTISVSPTSTTTYSIFASNGACSAAAVKTISVVPSFSMIVNASPAGPVCPGTPVNLIASGATSYTWSNSAGGNSIVVSPTATTIYSVTGNNNGCVNSRTISIVVANSPVSLNISSSHTVICGGQAATITASGAATYSWSNGATGQSIVVSPTQNTTYSVTGTNGGCSGMASISLLIAPSLFLNVTPATTICIGKTITLSATGFGNPTYSWNNISSPSGTISITPSVTSIYTVVVNGSTSCPTTSFVAITVTTNPQSTLSSTNSICGGCSGQVNLNTSGGTGPYSYSLSTGVCSLPCNNLCPGLYSIFTTDAAGCKTMNYFSIECSGTITRLQESNLNATINIFPNPATGFINIEFAGNDFAYAIYNVAGQVIRSKENNSEMAIVYTSDVPYGIYMVIIKTGENTITRKLVIQ